MSNLFDQAKNLAGQHPDQANQGLDALADQVQQRTGGQFDSQIDQARDVAGQQLGLQNGAEAPSLDADPEQGAPAPAAEQPAELIEQAEQQL